MTARDPEARFQQPLTVQGVSHDASEQIDDRRREANRFAVASLFRTSGKLTVQAGAFAGVSVLTERADGVGDILYKGLGVSSREETRAFGGQLEGAYELARAHTLRAGLALSSVTARSLARETALPVDSLGRQTSDAPKAFEERIENLTRKSSVFLQDEWRPTDGLTVNAGLRFDEVRAERRDSRFIPRINLVWTTSDGAVLHAGYARYFLPAPAESAGETPSELAGTTGATASLQGDGLRPETDDYYDVGLQRSFDNLLLGVDAYWRQARNLIAEGQFGPANLRRAFNFGEARIRGIEFTATYAQGAFQAWGNLAVARAEGRRILSNQFYFAAGELTELDRRFTPLSQDQTFTGSAGAAYAWSVLRLSGDLIYGSGLPTTPPGGPPNSRRLSPYAQVNLAAVHRLASFHQRPLDLRLDVINVFDARYRLRDGHGLGDGPASWGSRRGLFVGIEQAF